MLTSQRSQVKQSFFVKTERRIRPRLRLFLLCFLPFLCAFFTFPVAFVAGPLLHSFTCHFKSSGSWLRRSSPVLKQKEVERGEENELSVNAAGDPASGSCAARWIFLRHLHCGPWWGCPYMAPPIAVLAASASAPPVPETL